MKQNGLRWSTNPQYRRWSNFIQRCYNEKNPSYKTYGAIGIGIDEEWHPNNPQGFENFRQWIEAEIAKKPVLYVDGKPLVYDVVRKDVTKNYGSGNCILEPEGSGAQFRRTSVLSVQQVVELRRRKRTSPLISLGQFERETGISGPIISRALRGVTWAAANAIEPPLDTLDADVLLGRLQEASTTSILE